MYRMAFIFIFLIITGFCNTMAHAGGKMMEEEHDSLPSHSITFSPESASAYLISLIGQEHVWRTDKDTLRLSLTRLIDHFNEPYDSVRTRLMRFAYDSVKLEPAYLVKRDTLPLRWLSHNEFIIDTLALEKDPFVTRKTIIMRAIDTLTLPLNGTYPDVQARIDSLLQVRDTITEVYIDTRYLDSRNVQLYFVDDDTITPPLTGNGRNKSVSFLADSSGIVLSESRRVIMGNLESPFYIVTSQYMTDSLQHAVEALLTHTYERDSILLFFHNIDGRKTPFWLTSGSDELYRYWVKNAENDSITVWKGNPSKYEITLVLEDDVNVERMQKKTVEDIPITTAEPKRTLARLSPIEEIPVYWDHAIIGAFSVNQTYLANWARGGESSFASMFDLRASSGYKNNDSKAEWTNSGRLRYGTVRSKERGFRTSTDIVELNSQYNKAFMDKLDFSSVFYMKTQVAKGYKYPNDSVPISKFLNPGTFTLGIGVEYEPVKKTMINFSPLSYRNTFVLDTANINQRAHGVDPDKRSRQEMGGQLVIKSSISIMDDLRISNAVRLFSNYLEKPKNVDVDWELSIDKQINWYFTIRLNFHVIYDDDVRFPVLDANDEPVLAPDGSPRRVAKTQLNQFMGLTLSLRI
jgi:hypothetical protein